MEQFTETNLFDLKIGDRFYFLKDRNKKVWEIETINLRPIRRGKSEVLALTGKTYKEFKSDRKVIFLRKSECK